MSIGIICEFNPFHKGHKYLIDQAKAENETVICVMSGNFVQRGEFAIYDKFTRTKTALENGANIVIELPCAYSLMSAQGFAKNAVKLLESTGIVDEIMFGAECDDISKLKQVADNIKINQQKIVNYMKNGMSYPSARQEVIGCDILDCPNNILAIEYLSHTALPCRAVKRIGKGHDTDDIYYSSSAIRQSLPPEDIVSLKNCERAVLAKLRRMSKNDFADIEDVTEGLENRIVDAVRNSVSLEEIYDNIKTKRYTYSRIKRIILKSYLDITKNFTAEVPYIRILGFDKTGRTVLPALKEKAKLPIISCYKDIHTLDEYGKSLFELECRCTDLYNLGYASLLPCGTEQKSKIVMI